MGNTFKPEYVKQEEITWVKGHSLDVQIGLQTRACFEMIDRFGKVDLQETAPLMTYPSDERPPEGDGPSGGGGPGEGTGPSEGGGNDDTIHKLPKAEIVRKECTAFGITYYHYFVTDWEITMEFGGGETDGDNRVTIHNNRVAKSLDQETVSRFTVDDAVRDRMRQVLGASNYSMCLRNCEHIARYIAHGHWYCSQMTDQNGLHKIFVRYMLDKHKRLNNITPKELVDEPELVPL